VQVELVVPDVLPTLSAAVEVAAYRIVVEALANAARHSGSGLVTATLRVERSALKVEVADHEVAGDADWTPGVGLSSMRERATELGGTLVAGPTVDGGRVTADLPIG
jgi:two-component system NarL family sensor kinase